MLTGTRRGDRSPQAVIVELKQWERTDHPCQRGLEVPV